MSTLEKEIDEATSLLNRHEIDCLKELVEERNDPSSHSRIVHKFVAKWQENRKQTIQSKSGENDDQGKAPDNGGGGQRVMALNDFLPIGLDCAIKCWGEESFSVVLQHGEGFVNIDSMPKDDMLADVRKKTDGVDITALYFFGGTGTSIPFHPLEFTEHDACKKFGLIVGDLSELQKFCEKRLLPINDIGANIVSPNLKYVKYQDESDAFRIDSSTQSDKSYAIVVAGESGSGKSVLSCLKAKVHDFLPVYLLLSLQPPTENEKEGVDEASSKENGGVGKASSKDKDGGVGGARKKDAGELPKEVHMKVNLAKPKSDFSELHALLRAHLNTSHVAENSDAVQALCDMKAKLNVSRNKWARAVLEDALKKCLYSDDNARNWHDGLWKEEARPEKVAIILDEATDIDLVEGLVEVVRELTVDLKQKLAKERLILVLAGTGLDAIRYPGRVGTNPDYAKLIQVMGPAELDTLENEKSEEALRAIDSGLFSRVMKTNTRMLFRSVLPILENDMFHVDGKFEYEPLLKKQRLENRLKEVANSRLIMDHGPRFFVCQNSVGDLTGMERERLLKDAFLYHLRTALEKRLEQNAHESVRSIGQRELAYIQQLAGQAIQDQDKTNTSMDIFSRGIATRHGTSTALKYLSCFGLTCRLRPGWGDEFEELTALHCMRLLEVQGYFAVRETLNHAWPPKSNKKDEDIKAEQITELKKLLQEQKKTELGDLKIPERTQNTAIIFSQGTPNAQGWDVSVLRLTANKAVLEGFQCKHEGRPSGTRMAGWWKSLGIEYKQSEWNLYPTEGSAGYSYAGLDSFRKFLEEKLEKEVVLGARTMACSFEMPPMAEFHYPPQENEVRVWFREMLEPTISVFPVKKSA